jgi:HD superfamily phosphohydrolase
MTTPGRRLTFRDSLYGIVRLDDEVASLAAQPIVQRLRHVRLSNIDSIDLPGISNLSRYEHVLGVAYLASRVGFRGKLSHFDDLVLCASALLHDWAITSFGHLVEEALQYVGTGFDHQERLRQIAEGKASEEIFGVERQILLGRGTGLSQWLHTVVHSRQERDQLLESITKHIRGEGRFGRVISGDIDLDNIDNVFRMAYHLGLEIDKGAAVRLAEAIVDHDGDGAPIFMRSAENDIHAWRRTRWAVYENLMLAARDFIGKTMMLYATIRSFESGEIKILDWALTDFDYLERLLSSSVREAKDAAVRWIAGELWNFIPLQWMEGERPEYVKLRRFSTELTSCVNRTCFAYGIKDKRDRRLTVRFDDGAQQTFGADSRQWILGIGSPERRAFTVAESDAILEIVRTYFGTKVVGPASPDQADDREVQPSFL